MITETTHISIFVGLKEGYTGPPHTLDEVKRICQGYCDDIGLCVTVTPTEFIYRGGNEPGGIVGLINYPRFPKSEEEISAHAAEIAKRLLDGLKQDRISIVMKDKTIMLSRI
jgi:hypothetical protein